MFFFDHSVFVVCCLRTAASFVRGDGEIRNIVQDWKMI